jgi:hypothetical protein
MGNSPHGGDRGGKRGKGGRADFWGGCGWVDLFYGGVFFSGSSGK